MSSLQHIQPTFHMQVQPIVQLSMLQMTNKSLFRDGKCFFGLLIQMPLQLPSFADAATKKCVAAVAL